MLRKIDKERAAAEEQKKKDFWAKQAMKDVRGKDTWTKYDFAKMISNLDDKQRKQLMNSLIDDVQADHPDD